MFELLPNSIKPPKQIGVNLYEIFAARSVLVKPGEVKLIEVGFVAEKPVMVTSPGFLFSQSGIMVDSCIFLPSDGEIKILINNTAKDANDAFSSMFNRGSFSIQAGNLIARLLVLDN